MRNSRSSSTLSLLCCGIFAILLLAGAVLLPSLLRQIIVYSPSVRAIPYTLAAYYLCVPPAGVLLYCLARLLRNIRREAVFTAQNAADLRRISWCCAAVSMILLAFGVCICLIGSYTLAAACFVIAVASVFLALILRVIENVFDAAIRIKSENDMTI